MRGIITLVLVSLIIPVHLPDRPDLTPWVSGLHNAQGTSCCENDEAHALDEPDWRVSAEGHYQVFLEGAWWIVPDSAVVQGPNKYGRVLVWYYLSYSGQDNVHTVVIRCFLPAAGA
jgi:hypothetical protein